MGNSITDINFTKLGLGTSRVASLGTRLPQNDITALINTALDNGVRVLDTADTYASGDSERAIAKAVAGKRNEFFIMTKAGFPHMHLPPYLSPLNQVGKKVIQKIRPDKNFSKKYLLNAISKSLGRLKTDQVDAFLLHEPVYSEIASGECWEALEIIKKSGKAKYTGVSTDDVKVLEAGIATNTIDLVQTAVAYKPGGEYEVAGFCRQHNISFVANQVLARSVSLKHDPNILSILAQYGKQGQDLVDLLIEYVGTIQQADCILIGTKSSDHLKHNVKALTSQTPELKEIFEKFENI